MQESSVYGSIFAEGATETQRNIALNSLKSGLPVEMVAQITGLSIEEIKILQHQLTSTPAL